MWLSLLAGSYSFDRVGIAGFPLPLTAVLAFATVVVTAITGRTVSTVQPAQPSNVWRPFVATLCLVGIVTLSVTWSMDPTSGFFDAAKFALVPLYVLIMIVLWRRGGEGFLKLLLVVVALTGAAYTLLGLATTEPGTARLAVLGGGPNVYARIVALGVCATLFLLLRYRLPSIVRVLGFTLPAMGVVAIVLSGSRGGFFSLVAGLIAIIFASTRSIARLIVFTFFALLALIIIPQRIGGTALQTYWETRFVESTFSNLYFSRRDELWLFAWDIFQEKPLLGSGYGTFGYLLGEPRYYPHNLFLDVMAAAGLIGLIVLITTIAVLAARPLRRFRDPRSLSGPFLTLALCIFVASQVSGSLFDSRMAWLFLSGAYLASFVGGSEAQPRADE